MARALILGGANCVWDDSAAALDLFDPDAVYAVNDIGTRWAGAIAGWCSLHPEHMEAWRAERASRGFPAAHRHIGHIEAPDIDEARDYRWPGMNASGSSGLFAVKCALEDGFGRIVLAGVPMNPEGAHFFDEAPWGEHESFVAAWRLALPHIKDSVRSMSGFTRDLLGAPGTDWLAGDPPPHLAG